MRWHENFPGLFRFPHLINFLITFHEPADDEVDGDMAADYISRSGLEVRQALLEEGHAVLAAPEFPREEVSGLTNRGFADEAETREWLRQMLRVVEATAPLPIPPKHPRFVRRRHLFWFLGSSFLAWAGGGVAADEAAAAKDIAKSGPLHRQAILEQGCALLAEPDFPWEEIRSMTRRQFRSEEETREWLTRMLQVVEATAPSPPPEA